MATNTLDSAPSAAATLTVTASRSPLPFTDDVLLSGSGFIRSVHIAELRERIDALRGRFGLVAFTWTNPSPTAGTTTIRAQDIVDLRTALSQAYAAAVQLAPTFTDPRLIVGGTVMKAVHIKELRDAVLTLEGI